MQTLPYLHHICLPHAAQCRILHSYQGNQRLFPSVGAFQQHHKAWLDSGLNPALLPVAHQLGSAPGLAFYSPTSASLAGLELLEQNQELLHGNVQDTSPQLKHWDLGQYKALRTGFI